MKYTPKIGDKVKILKCESDAHNGLVGTIICNYYDSYIDNHVRLDNGGICVAATKLSPISRKQLITDPNDVRHLVRAAKAFSKKRLTACKHLWFPIFTQDPLNVIVICQHCLAKKVV